MRWVSVAACCALGVLAPATASAAGGPAPAVQGGLGIALRGSDVRYVAVGTRHHTVVERLRGLSGRPQRSSRIAGSFGIAGAANDGSLTGLSADYRFLVLPEMPSGGTYPPVRTRLVVLNARNLRVRERISLPGYSTVDAISPTGRWLYLIHYTSSTDLNRYEVRAYDLPGRRLMSAPVVDPRERGPMLGLPVTRVMSGDGRWAYTLYDRPGSAPFIHALDTQRRAAVCVDLPAVRSEDAWSSSLTLGPGGGTLRIERADVPLAVVDTRTFAVGSAPASRSPSVAARHRTPPGRGGGLTWPLAAVVAALLGMLALLTRHRLRSAPATQERFTAADSSTPPPQEPAVG